MRRLSTRRGLRTEARCSALLWPWAAPVLPTMAKMVKTEPGALTCRKEEGTPGDGDAAFGNGVAVSNTCALHANDTEDHGHKAQEHGHHHQGSGGLDVTWAEGRD